MLHVIVRLTSILHCFLEGPRSGNAARTGLCHRGGSVNPKNHAESGKIPMSLRQGCVTELLSEAQYERAHRGRAMELHLMADDDGPRGGNRRNGTPSVLRADHRGAAFLMGVPRGAHGVKVRQARQGEGGAVGRSNHSPRRDVSRHEGGYSEVMASKATGDPAAGARKPARASTPRRGRITTPTDCAQRSGPLDSGDRCVRSGARAQAQLRAD